MMNNAGIYPPNGRLHERPDEDLDRAFEVNAKGVWNGSKHAITQFLEQDEGGNIINLVSTAGLYGWQSQLAYNASKGAAKQITETLATEYGPDGIRANAICPGFAPTALTAELYEIEEFQQHVVDTTPLGNRWVSRDDVAKLAVFLTSDESEFITGQCHVVDGGHSLVYAHTKDLNEYIAPADDMVAVAFSTECVDECPSVHYLAPGNPLLIQLFSVIRGASEDSQRLIRQVESREQELAISFEPS